MGIIDDADRAAADAKDSSEIIRIRSEAHHKLDRMQNGQPLDGDTQTHDGRTYKFSESKNQWIGQ